MTPIALFSKDFPSQMFGSLYLIFMTTVHRSHYIIMGGHHPILSAGAHGNNPCLIAKLKPLMQKYGVTAYFSGHDHNLQVYHLSATLPIKLSQF